MNLNDINKKYAQLSQQLGDAHFRIHQHQKLVDELIREINKLNELAGVLREAANKSVEDKESNNQ